EPGRSGRCVAAANTDQVGIVSQLRFAADFEFNRLPWCYCPGTGVAENLVHICSRCCVCPVCFSHAETYQSRSAGQGKGECKAQRILRIAHWASASLV